MDSSPLTMDSSPLNHYFPMVFLWFSLSCLASRHHVGPLDPWRSSAPASAFRRSSAPRRHGAPRGARAWRRMGAGNGAGAAGGRQGQGDAGKCYRKP